MAVYKELQKAHIIDSHHLLSREYLSPQYSPKMIIRAVFELDRHPVTPVQNRLLPALPDELPTLKCWDAAISRGV